MKQKEGFERFNEQTLRVFEETDEGRNLTGWESVEEHFKVRYWGEVEREFFLCFREGWIVLS